MAAASVVEVARLGEPQVHDLRQTVVVEERPGDDHQVKELVRVEPQVKAARGKALRHAEHVQQAAEGVRAAHDSQQYAGPVVLLQKVFFSLMVRLSGEPVDGGQKCGEAVAEEERCPVLQVLALAKAVHQRDDDAAEGKAARQGNVEDSPPGRVEPAVVEPGHEGAAN